VPGRLEDRREEPAVFVDYAHTPDAFNARYGDEMARGRVVSCSAAAAIATAANGRSWRRRGRIADVALLTSDNRTARPAHDSRGDRRIVDLLPRADAVDLARGATALSRRGSRARGAHRCRWRTRATWS
jgi:hypothetical protein